MRNPNACLLAASVIGAAILFSAEVTVAKSPAECAAQYNANATAIKASGQTRAGYIANCVGRTMGAANDSSRAAVRKNFPSGAIIAPAGQ
jgi:hypothetical protein